MLRLLTAAWPRPCAFHCPIRSYVFFLCAAASTASRRPTIFARSREPLKCAIASAYIMAVREVVRRWLSASAGLIMHVPPPRFLSGIDSLSACIIRQQQCTGSRNVDEKPVLFKIGRPKEATV